MELNDQFVWAVHNPIRVVWDRVGRAVAFCVEDGTDHLSEVARLRHCIEQKRLEQFGFGPTQELLQTAFTHHGKEPVIEYLASRITLKTE